MSLPEVLSVREAREQLPSLLGALSDDSDEPVFIGAHRKAQGVLLSVDAYQRLREAALAERRWAVASADGSLRAEGLQPTAEYARDALDYADGLIDAEELRRRTLTRYRAGTGE